MPAAIRLSGDNILEDHCHLENLDGKVTIVSMPDSVTVRLRVSYGSINHKLTLARLTVPERKASRARTGKLRFKLGIE